MFINTEIVIYTIILFFAVCMYVHVHFYFFSVVNIVCEWPLGVWGELTGHKGLFNTSKVLKAGHPVSHYLFLSLCVGVFGCLVFLCALVM